MRRVLLSKTLNTRDLGGYPTKDGGMTVYGRFLRSDAPVEISEQDIRLLKENNITTIIDLRSDAEVAQRPCAFAEREAFEYHRCKMYGDGKLPQTVEGVAVAYFEMADEQKIVCRAMKLMAEATGGVLYHCTAGKDRTGLISALLLMLAGVSREDIVADYRLTEQFLGDELRKYCEMVPEIDRDIIFPKEVHIVTFLNLFLQKYHSVQEYLVQIGLTDETIAILKNKLTDKKEAEQV